MKSNLDNLTASRSESLEQRVEAMDMAKIDNRWPNVQGHLLP